ncbi:MAG TPA: Ig-like domain-containing protein [Polyangiaceae bacterium]
MLGLLGCAQLLGIEEHEFGSAPQSSGGNGGTERAGAGQAQAGEGGGPSPRAGHGGGGKSGAGGDVARPEAGQGGSPADDVSPEIIRVTPELEAVGVDPAQPIRIEFSEPMNPTSVALAYSQRPGAPTLSWTGDSVLTVTPGLEEMLYLWRDDDRPGRASDLLVSFGVDTTAKDKAENPLFLPLSTHYRVLRRVEHRISPCLDESGTMSPEAWYPAAPPGPDSECVKLAEDPTVTFAAGDSNGQGVVTILSYALGDLPPDLKLDAANVEFSFPSPNPVGTPHALYGDLVLEWIDDDISDPAHAFAGEPLEPVGTLASSDTDYPQGRQKGVTSAVSAVLDGTHAGLLVFRARFPVVLEDSNQSPDYVRVGNTGEALPILVLSYFCAECPETPERERRRGAVRTSGAY